MATICYEEVLKKGIEELFKVPYYIIQYDNLVQTLRHDTRNLRLRIEDIEGEVQIARDNGRNIKLGVEQWMQASRRMVTTADVFLNRLESQTCLVFIGDWNCICRCWHAKRAESLSKDVTDQGGEGIFQGGVSLDEGPPPLAPELAIGYIDLPSRGVYLTNLMEALITDGRLVIGVYGEEGAGKTMLVEKLAKDLEGHPFEHVVLIPEGGDVNTEGGLFDIQQLIAERVGFQPKYDNINQRRARVGERLAKAKNVLIIIDRLEAPIDFNSIRIPWPNAQNNCRIVIVSRSLTVCNQMRTQMNFRIQPLAAGESWDLFNALSQANNYEPGVVESMIKDPMLRISSRDGTWFPGQIKAYVEAIHRMVQDVRRRNWTLMLPAVSMFNIEHEERRECWEWSPRMEAKLVQVWFLHVEGRARGDWLKPNFHYGAYFVYKLMTLPAAEGFDTNTVTCTVGFYNENPQPRLCTLDPNGATMRGDGWLEIEMGTFYNHDYNPDATILLFVRDENTKVQKTGLIIRGIEFRQLRKK